MVKRKDYEFSGGKLITFCIAMNETTSYYHSTNYLALLFEYNLIQMREGGSNITRNPINIHFVVDKTSKSKFVFKSSIT